MSKKKPLPRILAVWRLAERHRPISGDPLGDYLQVAAPNEATRDFRGRPMPSFEKPYKLETDVLVTSERDRRRALHEWSLKYTLKQWGNK